MLSGPESHLLSRQLCCCVIAITLIAASPATGQEGSPAAIRDFEAHIRPLLSEHCLECHSGSRPKGGLSLESRAAALAGGESGPAVVPGDPDASLLIQAVRREGLEMPPSGPLPEKAILQFTEWIRSGAVWPGPEESPLPKRTESTAVTAEDRGHWAFQPPVAAALPTISDTAPVQHPVDAFIEHRLEAAGLKAVEAAAPRTLIRRVFLALTGLPPDWRELAAWEARIAAPSGGLNAEAYSALVDDLLSRPAYAEHWARRWLDVVRYAQSNGYERDAAKPDSWQYRDYVVRSFLQDKPWDRFLLEQLAGDELPDSSGETRTATGFYRLGVWDDEPDDARQAEFDDLDDILTTIGASMLGLTVNCARCHDHKFDPIPQTDYYRLLAFFRGLRRYELPAPSLQNSSALPAEDDAVVLQAALASAGSDVQPDAALKMVSDSALAGLRWTCGVREYVDGPPATQLLIRGQAGNPGPSVTPGFPRVLAATDAAAELPTEAQGLRSESPLQPLFPSSGRRLAFARWLVRPEHPLTARVIVNRVWHQHFGRGLVPTTGDFGRAGAKPSHPELLDWLAVDFVRHGWSIRHLQRRILTSAVWQRSSEVDPGAASVQLALERDPAAELLWRFPLRRLEAEAIRDRMLFSSGELNPEVGGPEMYPQLSGEVLAGQSKPGLGWKLSSPSQQRRRSLYAVVKRGVRDPLLESLDYSNTTSPLTERPVTTVAPQALIMLHGRFTAERSTALATRAMAVATDLHGQVQHLYRSILQRDASASELEQASAAVLGFEEDLRPGLREVSFRPDVPESLYSDFRRQLPGDAFLRGPRDGWEYRGGVWGGGYEGIDVVDKHLGPHALLTMEHGAGELTGELQLDETVELASLLLAVAPDGDAWRGLAVTIDRRRGVLEVRRRTDRDVVLASAKSVFAANEWIQFRCQLSPDTLALQLGPPGAVLQLECRTGIQQPFGRSGVAVWGGELRLKSAIWKPADSEAAALDLSRLPTAEPVQQQPPGWSRYDGNWQRLTDTEWRVLQNRGAKILWDALPMVEGEVSVELRMAPGQAEIGGLLLCVSDPQVGADNWYGYEVSLNIPAGAVLFGDHRQNFRLLEQQPATVEAGRWHQLRAVLSADRLQVYLDNQLQPVIDTAIPDRLPGVLAGLRTWGSEMQFRNFRVIRGGSEQLAIWPAPPLQPPQAAAVETDLLRLRRGALAALARTMFSLNEFVYVE
ncbi:MAG: hypothetical protein RLZZ436_302 [Planctomycetota bacterium]|jgi:hypothetical protein